MVFESLVADVLNRFLNKFVENVNKKQLNIGIWGGDVVLEKLTLKDGALDGLDLPIQTIYGHVGKLVLKIPWMNLYTAPLIICVERLFLLAVPNRDSVYDPEKEEQRKQDRKERKLKKIEEAKKREAEETLPKSDDTFLEQLITHIVKNIQIKVNDVHIRYEDRCTNKENPFAIGITLDHIWLYTTNEMWKETVILESVTKVNKVVDIDSLAIYWNCDCRLFKANNSQNNPSLEQEFKNTICTQNYLPQSFHYILGPINGSIQLVLNSKPELDDFKIAKYQCNIQLRTLAVGINKFQYHDMVRLAESLNQMQVSAEYRKYRPKLDTYQGHYKVWWRFAHTCILEEIVRTSRRSWTWNHIAGHRERCRKYASAFRSKLVSKETSEELDLQLKGLQKDIDVFNIILIRERVKMELEKEGLSNLEPVTDKGWFTRATTWFRRPSTESKPDPVAAGHTTGLVQRKLINALTTKEKEKLYKTIGYERKSAPTFYPKTYVNICIQFNLDLFEIQILDNLNSQSRVLHLKLSTVKVDMDKIPAIKGIKVNMIMQKLSVHGYRQGDFTPRLLVSRDLANKVHLLDLLFELNPPDEGINHRLHLNFTTLQIVYDVCTLKKMNAIFKAPNLRSYNQLHDHLVNVKNMSASGLRFAIERKKALDLKVNMETSYLIIPCNGIYTRNEDILIMNLGNLRINSAPGTIEMLPSGKIFCSDISMDTMISQSYDKFILNLDNMQVLFALNGEGWFKILQQNEVTPMHVLEPTSITAIFNKCLIKDDPNLPIRKITSTIQNIGITITNIRLRKLFLLLRSIRKRHNEGILALKEIREPSEPSLLQDDLTNSRTRRGSTEAVFLDHTQSEVGELSVKKVQAIQMDLTCKVDRLKVHILLEQMPSIDFTTTTEFLTLELAHIELEMMKQTFNIDVVARLGGVFAEVLHSKDKRIQIIDTPTAKDRQVIADYLVTVKLIMVDKSSPELHTKYNSYLRYLNIQFTLITLLLHQEVIVNTLQVVQTFMMHLKAEIRELKRTESGHSFHNVPKRFKDSMKSKPTIVTRSRPRQMDLMREETAFRLQIDLQNVNASICNNATAIADIAIQGCSVKATILNSSQRFVIRLKKIEMLDCHQQSLHPCILSVVGDEMLSIELVMYKVEQMLTQTMDTYPDMVVNAKIACMRIVYLNRFFSLFLIFLKKVFVFKTLFTDRLSIMESVTLVQQNTNITPNASYTQISVDLDAPILIVPLNSRSLDAVMLDLGYLTVTNERQALEVYNEDGVPVLVNYIEIILKNIRVDRVKLRKNYIVSNKKSLLLPVTFFIAVERNLSMSWHKYIPACDIAMRLQELHFTLTEEDYKMIMNILDQNFAETYIVSLGDDAADVICELTEYQILYDRLRFDAENYLVEEPKTQVNSSQTISLKISFLVDSISVTLYTGGATTLDDISTFHPSACLARLSLQILSIERSELSNGKIMMTFRVVNCFLDDLSEGGSNKDARLLQRKDGVLLINQEHYQDEPEFPQNTLLDVSYTKTDLDTFIEVCVHEFQMIISLDFIKKLRYFLSRRRSPMLNEYRRQSIIESASSMFDLGLAPKKRETVSSQPPSSMLVIKFEKPDIVVVVNVDDTDNDAFTITCEMLMKLRSTSKKMFLDATLKDLQVNSCCFHVSRKKPRTGVILRPCTISVLGSVENQVDINLDTCITEIKTVLTSRTIDLFTRMYKALYGNNSNKFVNTCNPDIDYSDIWEPKSLFGESFWFLDDQGIPIIDFNAGGRKSIEIGCTTASQICVISVPSFVVFVEAEVNKKKQPLIVVHIKLESIIYDWKNDLSINNNIGLQVSYYNVSLASMEPLVEPIERVRGDNKKKTQKSMWEFTVNLQMSSAAKRLLHIGLYQKLAELNITISSQEKLEVTLTKTGIDILSKLIKLFLESDVSSTSGGTLAPIVVKNMSGTTITLVLSQGPFQLAAIHNSNRKTDEVLASGSQLGLCMKEDESTWLEKSTSPDNAKNNFIEIVERYLTINVTIDSDSCVLCLPVFCTDMRFFSLKHNDEFGEKWGLLWDISLCEGSTVLTLRGIIKVYNHLKQPIHIYYLPKKGDTLVRVGTVQPSNERNLPIQSIYTETGALFFSVKGYQISNQPFAWKDLKSTHTISKILSCSEIQQGGCGSFYINVFGCRKHLYYENSHHYTQDSAMYNIHIHPGVLLKNFLPVDAMICLDSLNLKKESIIKAGKQIQMVYVEPRKTKMFIKIPNYLNKEWISENYLQWDLTPFDVIRLISNEGDDHEALQIYVFTKEDNGTICKQLSCQFWMLNKTGLDIAYRQFDIHDNTCNHPKDFQEVVLFSLWGSAHTKNYVSIQISNGEWSKHFSLGAAGSSGVVCCKVGKKSFYIGVQMSFTSSKLTEQVTFTPYYVLVNNHNACIDCQEADCPDDQWVTVKPKDCTPFWPNNLGNRKEICLRIENSEETSIPFSYVMVHTTLIRLNNKYGAVYVDVHKIEGAIYVTFWPYKPGLAPTLLINDTNRPIQYWETATESSTLEPRQIQLYTWKSPTGSRTVTYRLWKKGELTDTLQKDGVEKLRYKSEETIYWLSFLDGTQRITLFTNDPEVALRIKSVSELEPIHLQLTFSIHSIGISFVNNTVMKEILYVTISSNGAIWESRKKLGKRFKPLPKEESELIEAAYSKYQGDVRIGRETHNIVQLGRQLEVNLETKEMIQPRRRYLHRIFKDGVWFRLKMMSNQVTMHGKIAYLQIDNQMSNNVFPVVLAPVPLPKTVQANQENKPFAELSIVRRYTENSALNYFKYFKILIQAFHVKLEMDFVSALGHLLDWENVPEEVEVIKFAEGIKLTREPLRTHVKAIASQEEKYFYDLLHFSPLKIHMSFSLLSKHSHTEEHLFPLLMFILHGLGVTLTDFNNVVLKLGCFERKFTFLSTRETYHEVTSHYISQILKQTYVLVLGLDLIGNPWGLFMGIRQGVTDLFYEPYQGIIQGPEDFGEGLFLGLRSMLSNTVGGTIGAMSKLSGAIGTGIAVLTFDHDYQLKRKQSINQLPQDVQLRIARNGRNLVMGVVDGVCGVIASPISGAHRGGVRGCFIGMGRGLVGLLVRPIVGLFDCISGSLGLVSKKNPVLASRVRLPRRLSKDGLVRPYVRKEAEGNMLFEFLDGGRFVETDSYEYHLSGINGTHGIVLLTNVRIMYILAGSKSLAWEYKWEAIEPPVVNQEGILITPTGKKKGGLPKHAKQIPIKSNKQKESMFKKIQELRESNKG